MEILFANRRQVEIADLLWAADTEEEIQLLTKIYGDEVKVVREMLVAAAFDEVNDVSDAKAILEKF